ncbi:MULTISPECIES: DUF3006 domain-containing protein [Enterocloster]|uniref:Uncharacterized protein n=1 Tax=Enterocloster lavalensis TaxID=460384 RepID=A0A1I0JK81_9FIRM|nr:MULTISPECIES: DUF3006 domain-containing protein [Enterocloster]RHR55291.1 DUF3006 domain-containing protein [Clostridium sp. AF18-27]MBS5605265.1 DUF3006 domain-containing protein [Enterocloster asparagiformis]MCB6346940.1 DUF3006 domain-containing protein [Enterocloster lavalensis]MDR3757794.1 DUF3006 domain-containing protein [Enterocloster sp.]PST30464.1 DUF3006 domain-containing protein [Enterocloster lavalensis]
MKYIIDRLEEGIAVCENELKKLISIPKDLLPDGLKEGDVLEEQEGRFLRDEQGTEARRKEMRKKLMDLFD